MTLNVKSVAVIGAGVSGVSAAIHLRAAGLNVTVFERTCKSGGVWVYDDRTAIEPSYPSMLPSTGDSPLFNDNTSRENVRADSPQESEVPGFDNDLWRLHAPPGPCYAGLMNNVSTVEMQLQVQPWRPGTSEFVLNDVLAQYIQDAVQTNNIEDCIRYHSLVRNVSKSGTKWIVRSSELTCSSHGRLIDHTEEFDAVVVASGHYHACRIPDIPGLREWKQQWPDRVSHSKSYRSPEAYRDQTVLLIGAGVSSTDIARELGSVAAKVYQSSRGGMYDLPSSFLPDNGVRIGGIKSFGLGGADADNTEQQSRIPQAVQLENGGRLCDIDAVIVCTGYMMSYPFLRPYHDDVTHPEDANDTVLVTADGAQTHNLHKDIFYIPDPSLSFIGVPYHVATFSLFEFQAIVLAAAYSGRARLPSQQEMRVEYRAKILEKGAGRTFHSLMADGAEIAYVQDSIDWVNTGRTRAEWISPHSKRWLEAYDLRLKRRDERKALVEASKLKDARTRREAASSNHRDPGCV